MIVKGKTMKHDLNWGLNKFEATGVYAWITSFIILTGSIKGIALFLSFLFSLKNG